MAIRSVSARTRAEDGNGRARFLVWWAKWRDPLFAAILLPTAIGVFVLGLDKRASDKASAKITKESCLRAKVLGPPLALDYERRHVLTGADLALYRSLIPKSCPK